MMIANQGDSDMPNRLIGKNAIMAAAAIRYLFRIRNDGKHGAEARAFIAKWILILRAELALAGV
jgi:hypothetical protein